MPTPLRQHPHATTRRSARVGLAALFGTATPLALATQGARTKAPKGKGRSKPAAPPSSEESRADRDRRLSRECRGRPNAGACLGYGQ